MLGPTALVLDRPSKMQLIWSRQTMMTSRTSSSSASKTDCFCCVIFLNCILWTFGSCSCNLRTFCCANEIKDAYKSRYVKYLLSICRVGVAFFGLRSFCWIHRLWYILSMGSAAGQAAPVSCTKVPTFRNLTTHLTDPGGMAGWVGLVGWLIAVVLPTKWSNSHPSV